MTWQVRRMGQGEVGQCVASRKTKGGTNTWIAFVGDSNMRQKMHTFITFLPYHLHYTYYLGNKQVSRETIINAITYHRERPPTFDIIGRIPSNTTTQRNPHDSGKTPISSNTISSNDNTSHWHHRLYGTELIQDLSSISAMYDTGGADGNGKESEVVKETNPLVIIPPNPSPSSHIPSLFDPLLEDEVPSGGDYELRVTLVWSTGKKIQSRSNVSGGRTDVTKLEDWVKAASTPHVIVVGQCMLSPRL